MTTEPLTGLNDDERLELKALRACVPAGGSGGDDTGFMAYYTYLKGEGPKPKGSPCALCGLPCDNDRTAIFGVDRELVPEYRREEAGERPLAHVYCAFSIYRSRTQQLERVAADYAKQLEEIAPDERRDGTLGWKLRHIAEGLRMVSRT